MKKRSVVGKESLKFFGFGLSWSLGLVLLACGGNMPQNQATPQVVSLKATPSPVPTPAPKPSVAPAPVVPPFSVADLQGKFDSPCKSSGMQQYEIDELIFSQNQLYELYKFYSDAQCKNLIGQSAYYQSTIKTGRIFKAQVSSPGLGSLTAGLVDALELDIEPIAGDISVTYYQTVTILTNSFAKDTLFMGMGYQNIFTTNAQSSFLDNGDSSEDPTTNPANRPMVLDGTIPYTRVR
jgi:hypothetical protein